MSELVDWSMDFAVHEQTRVAATLAACADDVDLMAIYHDECRATRMLYKKLDPEQERIRRELQDAGILPNHDR